MKTRTEWTKRKLVIEDLQNLLAQLKRYFTEQSEKDGSDGHGDDVDDQESSECSFFWYDDNDRTELELSRIANPKIPWIIKCLELQEDEDKKKRLVTTDELLVGDIIAVEKPLVASCFVKGFKTRCSNCLKVATSWLIPCPGCTTGEENNFKSM